MVRVRLTALAEFRESLWGLDSDKIMTLGGLAIALFFVSLWFSELQRGEILTPERFAQSLKPPGITPTLNLSASLRLFFSALKTNPAQSLPRKSC